MDKDLEKIKNFMCNDVATAYGEETRVVPRAEEVKYIKLLINTYHAMNALLKEESSKQVDMTMFLISVVKILLLRVKKETSEIGIKKVVKKGIEKRLMEKAYSSMYVILKEKKISVDGLL